MLYEITVVMQRDRDLFHNNDRMSDDKMDEVVDKVYEMSHAAGFGDPFFAVSVGEPSITMDIEAERLEDAILKAARVVREADLGLGEIHFVGIDRIGLEVLDGTRKEES